MKLAIIGSRDFSDYDKARKVYKNFFESLTTKIISGGAIGADLIGKRLAEEFGVEYEEYLPDWDLYKGQAGHVRNTKIINASQMALVFWNGYSKGTKDSLDKLASQKKPVFIIYI